jgi:hypothetical protein
MGYKRPVAESEERAIASALAADGDALVPRHTFSFAFTASLVGFLLLFIGGTLWDIWRAGGKHSLWDLVTGPGGGSGDSLLYIAQVVAAILGVALTVVAIVVQLAANRYTPKIIDLFIRDPVNVPTLALFVIAVLEGIWVGHVRQGDFIPEIGFLITLTLSTASLLILLPYFRHVFTFLDPANVVHRIRDEIIGEVRRARRRATEAACARGQARVLSSLDHLFDIARTSVNNLDRTLATEVIFAFRDALVRSYAEKANLPEVWFKIFAGTTTNADFLNFPEPALRRFEKERTWFERKVFWQLNLVFQAAVGAMRGVCSTIGLVTREIGEDAIRRGDKTQARLVVRMFNTLLRSGLNGGDIRTLYNLLQQYRLFAEVVASQRDRGLVREIFEHFRYYGRLAEGMGLGFILETAAHDLAMLVKHEIAIGAPSADVEEDVERVLSIARDIEVKPRTRQGVLRSQAILAAHLLSKGRDDLARKIATAFSNEEENRLSAIRDEVLAAEDEFFELTERVASFGFLEEDERPHIATFFEWLAIAPSAATSRRTTA